MSKNLLVLIIIAGLAVLIGTVAARKPCCLTTSGAQQSARASSVVPQDSVIPQDNVTPPMSVPSQLVVYYFHGNARCVSCYKIEQYSRAAVEQNYANELKDGRMQFRIVNIEKPGNDHFVYDYQLYTKSVVLSLVKGGKQVKYKNLDRVWDFIKDENKFHDYVRDEIKTLLGEL